MPKDIVIINGPNLNMLGLRNPALYGSESFESYLERLRFELNGCEIFYFQSNSEGEIIDMIQKMGRDSSIAGIVINPGAYAHYSYAIADAIADAACRVVEVHISNIHARETFRHQSVTASACCGVLAGLGLEGYRLAAEFLLRGVS